MLKMNWLSWASYQILKNTKRLCIHQTVHNVNSFHGNFFKRSIVLLSTHLGSMPSVYSLPFLFIYSTMFVHLSGL
ncbi:hypothetical protein WH47_04763 [Habropoda laboriosa]|uniref:Uncharacterized protein n=1 Tax=Habropoda laboriosa TaxID=597456 RepID=A0A0L7QXM9_9HYME|nr:hypothetical protein WH47_04763 [Habropoda laboriosa]